MVDLRGKVAARLTQISDILTMNKTASTIPWDPDSTIFPTRKNLPKIEGAPDGAAWFWGPDDYVGRLNLLTPARVTAASKEIRTGEIVPVNLPLDTPATPAFGRESFQHTIKNLAPGVAYDDVYHMNTQSGTQWDGLRHIAHMPTKTFYNFTTADDIEGPRANHKCSIHHMAEHGIAGRGLLLDVWGYAQANGIAYDPLERFEISHELLTAVGRAQGVDIRPSAAGGDVRPGDMLFIRAGWTQAYQASTPAQREAVAKRPLEPRAANTTRYAGVSQETAVVDWLHDCYFATVAGDSPTFEAWPTAASYHLHEFLLALWGAPIGEMLDLERLAAVCAQKRRFFFFFTSSPANCPGGVSSHVNGQAIF